VRTGRGDDTLFVNSSMAFPASTINGGFARGTVVALHSASMAAFSLVAFCSFPPAFTVACWATPFPRCCL
jgi:hypothetical protein